MRVAIIGSPEKPLAGPTLERAARWLESRASVVFSELTHDSKRVLAHQPDLIFVLGGDGTLIAAAHNLGCRQVPIVGVNLGKLGFLAEFTIGQLEREGDFLFTGEMPMTRRIMLGVKLEARGGVTESLAVNDCVVLAGQPFRMIEMRVAVDGEEVAEIRGDGLIVSTPSGSTAHNLSAGGPILEPTAEAFIITPICAHALTFRPLAVDARRTIEIRVARENEGTTVAIDGRQHEPLRAGDRLVLSRYPAEFLLVRNPRRSVWFALRQKLMWGRNPTNHA